MNPFTSLTYAVDREEEMDAVELPPECYARVLADLARVNAVTMARRPTIDFVARAAKAKAQRQQQALGHAAIETTRFGALPVRLRILDVGFGDGDMLRSLARWGAKHDVALDLVGVDLNPKSAPAARERPSALPIDYRTGDYANLAGEGWDVIISSLVAHHMTPTQRLDFLRFMHGEASEGWLINDLHRARLPFVGYPWLARLMMVDPIVRRDGQLSIARSFRPAEWGALLAEAGISDARVRRWFPWRLCVEHLR